MADATSGEEAGYHRVAGPDRPVAPLSFRGNLALSYATKGWHVFPIRRGSKNKQRLRSWGAEATTDPTLIRRWWTSWPDDNIGIACGPSGLCVFDLDQKNGKDGRNDLDELELDHGLLPETLTATTPTGGTHLYFRGETGSPNGKMAPGIDIKSAGSRFGGYVLAPGSETEIGTYAWSNDLPVADLPVKFKELIDGAVAEATTATKALVEHSRLNAPLIELDLADAIEWARQYLIHDAPPAIEGDHGDKTTFTAACMLHNRGVSEATALDMMLEYYNDRCEPPWQPDDLKVKVGNAYRYARDRAGSESASADFAEAPDGTPTVQRKPKRKGRFLDYQQLLSLRPPEWLIRGLVPVGTVGILYGPSGSLKSFLAFHVAACCAVNREAFPGRSCKRADAFYIAAEGGHGFKLRAEAWTKHHGTTPDRLFVLPGSVYLDQEGEASALAEEINGLSSPEARKLIVVDTLSANFTGKENTDDVAGLLRRCAELGRVCRATVIIVHHTGKDGAKEERGHYSIRANADFSIRMDRTDDGAKVEVQKLKDADAGRAMFLRALRVEVAPGEEFSSSLVLLEEPAGAKEFDEIDAHDDVVRLLATSDGMSLIRVAEALRAKWNRHPNTLKDWVRKVVGEPGQTPREVVGGRVWMEKAERGNGLVVRFARSPDAER